ncbi:MAG: hypothetical protein HKO87_03065 [Acidimicrobiia bacterium]|nr:hypothetical protein [Acidimicrobiia bacterium]
MKKVLAATMVAAMLITGAAVASAQEAPEDDATVTENVVTTVADVIQGLVDDGTLTQEQADNVTAALEQHRANRPGKGGAHLTEIAEVLGLTVDELKTQLQEGATLADVAGDQVDDVAQLITDQMNERVDQALEDGRITEEEAAEKRAEIEEKVTEILNGEADFGRRGHGRRGHGPRGGGFDGAPSDEASETNA